MTDPGPILGDTSSQDAAVSAALERFSIFDEPLPLFKVFTFQTWDLKLFAAKAINISQNYWKQYILNNAAKCRKNIYSKEFCKSTENTYSKECCKSTKTQGVPAAAAPDTIFSRTIECLSRSPDPLFLLLLTTFTSDRNYKDLTFRPRSGYKKRIPTHTCAQIPTFAHIFTPCYGPKDKTVSPLSPKGSHH